jgi:DNA-binding SARP family transcriptional activator
MEAVTAMAEVRYARGYIEHTLQLYLRALNEDNTREDLHRRVMQLFAEMGRRSEAAAHYQRTQRDLSLLGLALSPETEAIYHQIVG